MPNFDPVALASWLDDEARQALDALGNPLSDRNVAKKRRTVIRVAYQIASNAGINHAFEQPDTCDVTVWEGRKRSNGTRKVGWKELPEVQHALAVCVAKLIPYLEAQTVREIDDYRRAKAVETAKHAAQAPAVLGQIMIDPDTPAQHRIKAANDLMAWDAPEDAALVRPSTPAGDGSPVTVINSHVTELSDEQLERIAAFSDTANGGG